MWVTHPRIGVAMMWNNVLSYPGFLLERCPNDVGSNRVFAIRVRESGSSREGRSAFFRAAQSVQVLQMSGLFCLPDRKAAGLRCDAIPSWQFDAPIRAVDALVSSGAGSQMNTPFWVPRNELMLSKPILVTFHRAASIA
jgi:hypothetical protein